MKRWEKYKEYYEKYRREHKEEIRARNRKYVDSHQEKCKTWHRETRDKTLFGGNRAVALSRDNYRCTECFISNDEHLSLFGDELTVHHIDGKGVYSEDKNNNLENLQTLCYVCHGKKHGRRKKV